MPRRHLVIGGGTAGVNAMRTIRTEESEPSDMTLVSAEKPYSRMVLPYYLDRSIAESHVYTATAKVLAGWGVKTHLGRRAAALDTRASVCTLDDGTTIEASHDSGIPWADVKKQRKALETKFESLVTPVLGAYGTSRMYDAIERLDSLSDVGELARAAEALERA